MADSAANDTARPTVGIISLGDMGSGLARLLIAHGYTVVTNLTGRSEDTLTRARETGAVLLPSDTDLVTRSEIILSVVPPRDAYDTALRIVTALTDLPPLTRPLYFADMNATSPRTVRGIYSLFTPLTQADVRFLDGSILGGPPLPPLPDAPKSLSPGEDWSFRPLLPTSGPTPLPYPHLTTLLRMRHISPDVGAASGLKMCFASLSKGFTAIAVQTVATAKRLGVFTDLTDALRELTPANLERTEKAVFSMAPKAYRWVREMEEISATHAGEGEDGGWGEEFIFRGAAEVFRTVAEDTVLGQEKIGKRDRGKNAEDVAEAVVEGLKKRRKTE